MPKINTQLVSVNNKALITVFYVKLESLRDSYEWRKHRSLRLPQCIERIPFHPQQIC